MPEGTHQLWIDKHKRHNPMAKLKLPWIDFDERLSACVGCWREASADKIDKIRSVCICWRLDGRGLGWGWGGVVWRAICLSTGLCEWWCRVLSETADLYAEVLWMSGWWSEQLKETEKWLFHMENTFKIYKWYYQCEKIISNGHNDN